MGWGQRQEEKNRIAETRPEDCRPSRDPEYQFGEGTAQSPKSGRSHIYLRPLVAAHVYWGEMTQAIGVICPQI